MNCCKMWGCFRIAAALALIASCAVMAGKVISVPSSEAQTISHAFIKAKIGDTILVDKGVYRERIFVENGVALVAKWAEGTVIDGKGRGTVVTLGKNSSITGFEIRNGTIGVFSKHPGNAIRNCRIVQNWQTGIICVRHLPSIEDNVIAFNRASGIQGWDVRSTAAAIAHNTIAFNGNNGIAMGGGSNAIIERNILAFNERFGIKVTAESEKVKVTGNNIYKNLWSLTKPIPAGNYVYDPQFASPRGKMDFTVEGKAPCAECVEDKAPGARLFPSYKKNSGSLY